MFRHSSLVIPFILMLSNVAIAQTGGWGTPVNPAPKQAERAPIESEKDSKPIDLAQAEKALEQAWDASPLFARNAMFVREPAPMFGAFSARASNVFQAGEEMLTYAEPMGYLHRINANVVDFGLNIDFLVKSKAGQIIGGQENFKSVSFVSNVRNRELMLNLSMRVTGVPPGEYVLEWKLRDQNSNKVAVVAQPFQISQ